jgi:CDP-glucose 4,6-dehydratase
MNLKYLESIYSGKNVFITGHTGFKGSWLAFILARVGANVTGYSLPALEKSHFNSIKLGNKLTSIYADIRDLDSLKQAINECSPEFVFHLAAQALVRESYIDPIGTYSSNVMGSLNLLEAVRLNTNIKSLVYITSDKCYENNEWVWGYRESDLLGGIDPYSSSKASAEILFSSFTRSFFSENNFLGYASVRAGNVIGGGDWSKDRIIPDIVRAIENNMPIILRSPNSTRPWQHVLEPISAYLYLASKLYLEPKKWRGSWNFGPRSGPSFTVKEVVLEFIKYLGKGNISITEDENKYHEAQLLQLNCDKANKLLNWHPRWSQDKTIEATASWYKGVMNNANPQDLTAAQIESYFEVNYD